MPDVTLFLTRFPKSEFTEKADITWDTTGWTQEEILRLHGWKGATLPTNAKDVLRLEQELLQSFGVVRNGLWSTLGVMEGPKVSRAQYFWGQPKVPKADYQNAQWKAAEADRDLQQVTFKGFPLLFETPGGAAAFKSFKEYTTVEHYRSDFGGFAGGGWADGYIMLQPLLTPYTLRVNPRNSTVQTLRANHPGNCLEIIDGIAKPTSKDPAERAKQALREEKEHAILIHECPSIGWVVGCIGPRPLNDRRVFDNVDGNPSHKALNEIYNLVNRAGGTATLFVLDWA